MARAINKLSQGHVQKLKTPGVHSDGGGLILRIAKGGSKQWQFRYRWNGKERYMGLGGVQTVSLSQAREKALYARQAILDGVDPIDQRKRLKQAALSEAISVVTFREASEQYIKVQSPSWKNAKHRAQWHSTLETYAWPVIGNLSVADIDTTAVLRVLEPIWHTKNETASRLRGRIESVLDWAAVRNYRTGENPARWKGHLQSQLPSTRRVNPVRHHSALQYREVGAFMGSLRKRSGSAALALEFTILTASRTSEVIGAKWDEIDLQRGIWTIPAERMKAGKEHAVPLNDRTRAILMSLADVSDGGGYVFPGMRSKGLSNMAMLQLLKRMDRNDLTVHGFRSTFRDWAGDMTAYPREVMEACLAHTIQGVEAAYRRSDALEKRRRLLREWENYCAAPAASQHAQVLSLMRDA